MSQTDDLDNGLFPTKDRLGLRNEHELIQKALQWSGVGFWAFDVPANQLHLSGTGLFERLGYASEEVATVSLERWTSLIHPDDELIPAQTFVELLEGRENSYESRYRIRDASGEYATIHAFGRVTERDADGKPLQMGGIARDETRLAQTEDEVQRRDVLIAAANESARLLLRATVKDFEMTVWRVLHLLGSAAKVDRIHVWKDYVGLDDRPHATLLYEWLEGVTPPHSQWASHIAYDKTFPNWYATLCEGQCISHVVKLTPEQKDISPNGAVSILAAPIQYNGKPWGFIGFGDCNRERTWSKAEKGVLRALGVLLATAIQRHEVVAALEADQTMLNQFFETSPVSLFITTNGIIQRCNQRFADDLSTGVGQPVLTSYVSPVLRNEVIEEVCRKGHVVGRSIQFWGKDGKILDTLTTYQPIVYEGKPSILCWSVDVSELKETEKALVAAKNLAEEAIRIKSEFLSRMSHELLTPMNAIVGMVHLCSQTELTDQQKEYLQTVQTASSDLLGMIHNILDFSKAEMGKLDPEEVLFNLNNILKEVMSVAEGRVIEKNLSLKLDVDANVPGSLVGTPLRLKQVLNNLINNAVKFTEQGGVRVMVRPADSVESADLIRLQFVIQDTGIGMPMDQVDTLFLPFFQADSSSTRRHSGTGLGLAISKNLIESMGGSIGVSSTPEQGSTFHFTAVFRRAK